MVDTREYQEAAKRDAARKLARKEAEARVRKALQPTFGHIPVFRLKAEAGEKGFHKNMIKRHDRLLEICASTVLGMPVTPPPLPSLSNVEEEKHTYHIVEITGSKDRFPTLSEDGRRVSLLFRESNLYFIAFCLGRAHENQLWFRFRHEKLPSYMTSVEIGFGSSYEDISDIPIGAYCLDDIVHTMVRFNPDNAWEKTNERVKVMHCAALMLSEALRFGDVQIFAKCMLSIYHRMAVPHLDKKIHSWSVLGKYGMLHLSGVDALDRIMEGLVPGLYNPLREKYEIWNLIGRRCTEKTELRRGRGLGEGLLVLLYDEETTIDYILAMKRKDHAPPENHRKVILQQDQEGSSFTQKEIVDTSLLFQTQVAFQEEDRNTGSPKPIETEVRQRTTQVAFQEEDRNTGSPKPIETEVLQRTTQMQQLKGSDSALLNFHGVSLYGTDLDSLQGTNWLTDTVLALFFEIFAQHINDSMLLVPPSISSLLSISSNTAEQIEALKLSERSLVLLPINDEQGKPEGGGSHWSLLILDNTKKEAPRILNYDSLGDKNLVPATDMLNLLKEHLPCFQTAPMLNVPFIQQSNTYDCGVYCIAVAEFISKWWAKNHEHADKCDWIDSLNEQFDDPSRVEELRPKFLRRVESYVQSNDNIELEKW